VRRISGSASTSSPSDARTTPMPEAGYPSPISNDAKGDHTYRNGNHDQICLKLGGTAKLALPEASYPTARATDGSKGSTGHGRRATTGTGEDLPATAGKILPEANWPTSLTNDARGSQGHRRDNPTSGGMSLPDAAKQALPEAPIGNTLENYRAIKASMRSGKPIANTHPSLQAQGKPTANTHPSLQAQLILPEDASAAIAPAPSPATGATPNGSPARTDARGPLNPELSRWLQAFPAAWEDCAAMATQSMSSKRRSSSPPRSKRPKRSERAKASGPKPAT
jgi:hypothetical protein